MSSNFRLLNVFFAFFLVNAGTPPNGDAYGSYPTVVISESDASVLIVQSSAYTKYLGNLSVEYDNLGEVTYWEGNPIYLSQTVAKDTVINELLLPIIDEVEQTGQRVLGKTNVLLDSSSCRYGECNFGNFLTDAMVTYYTKLAQENTWTEAAIAIINPGGIRTPIVKGNITFNDLMIAQPFENTIDYGEIQGKFIKVLMETAAMPYNSRRVYVDLNLLQVSGIRVVYDITQPIGNRVKSLQIQCNRCDIPTFEDVDLEAYYSIAVPSFLVTGGDGFSVIAENIRNHTVGPLDSDVIADYIAQHTPIITGLDQRIVILGAENARVIFHD